MSKYFFIATLVLSLQLSAQNKFLFDTSKINANSKLIGRYPQYDKQKTYKDLNFIIEDPTTIKKIMSTFVLGKEGENTMEDPDFRITIVENFDEAQSWIVNPSLKSIMDDGHTYEFNIKNLKELAKKYPFDYRFDKIAFKSKSEYENYFEKQKTNKTFLFAYPPQFKYEGSFDVQFPRNQQFSSPKAISEYLEPLIEKIVSKDDYRVGYYLNDKNMKDQSQYTMTITGSKKLYDELPLGNLKKESWEPTAEEGWFFYRTK